MLSHEFLSDDFMIQRTVFSSGVTVTTNMGLGTWDGQGEKVSARAFRATGGNLGSIESQFTTDIRRTGYE
jgi:hypothetical protein